MPPIDVATFRITTDRLLLSPREGDFPAWVALAADPEAMEPLGVEWVGGAARHHRAVRLAGNRGRLDIRSGRGRGYTTEGAAAAIDFAVDRLGWCEIIHCIEEGNTASEGVAEELGSARLRTIRPPPQAVEVVVWGQSRAERRGRQGRESGRGAN